MQTMARDVTVKLYGSDSYKGLTSEQVLSGWLFYFDEWFRDYAGYEPEISRTDFDKSRKKLLERKSLITLLGTGEAFRIYPYRTAGGYTEWLSLTGRRPAQMDLEQWVFMSKTLPTIKELLLSGRNIRADEELKVLIRNQKKYAGEEVLPSEKKLKAEVLYNRYARPLYLGLLVLLLSGFYLFAGLSGRCVKRLWRVSATVGLIVAVVLNLSAVGMIWWLGGHVPMSNGTEMMLFMSAVSLVTALAVRQFVVRGSLLLVSAMALMVAGMASRTPQIGSLMPVLASPLLALHVMVIMCAYVLFVLMAVLSVIALLTKKESLKTELCRLNRLILLPAVFLLAVGIMIGAVWANRSWGRYWGWDPKETCALVMLVVYSLPLHWASPRLSCFRRPRVLHVYLLVALATVLFTYFGANFLIPGLHSYA